MYAEIIVKPRTVYKGEIEVPDNIDPDDIDEDFIIKHWDEITWDESYAEIYGYDAKPKENPYDCDIAVDNIY